MRLYTRQGDQGRTSLFDGTQVSKHALRIEAYGTIDELNSHLGLAVAWLEETGQDLPGELRTTWVDRIQEIQGRLFQVGAEMATPEGSSSCELIPRTTAADVVRLEQWIDEAVAAVPPLSGFVLPGGTRAGAQLHICRTVCRRAERRATSLAESAPLNPQVLAYLNRLSDLLFAWSRHVSQAAGKAEVPWDKPPEKGESPL